MRLFLFIFLFLLTGCPPDEEPGEVPYVFKNESSFAVDIMGRATRDNTFFIETVKAYGGCKLIRLDRSGVYIVNAVEGEGDFIANVDLSENTYHTIVNSQDNQSVLIESEDISSPICL